MTEHPRNFREALAQLRGEGLSEFRQRIAERDQSMRESKPFIGLAPSEWPPLIFNWDTSTPSQRYSLDGTSLEAFNELFPNGFELGWVALTDLDDKLDQRSRRDTPEELWGCGCQRKLASTIAHLSRGGAISPPLVKPLNTDGVILDGGNHRFAAAKAVGLLELPIYVAPEHKQAVSLVLSVQWYTPSTDRDSAAD